MASQITFKGKPVGRGDKMVDGKGWRLVATKGKVRFFVGTLLGRVNLGKTRLAVFSVPK
jgi:hypothetical protein